MAAVAIVIIIAFINFFLQFSSVPQSYPTLCDPLDCSMPGFPVLHQLLELAQVHVHWVFSSNWLKFFFGNTCCSVTKLCLTLFHSTNCCTLGFPVFHPLGVCSSSCSLSWWCHPNISSSAALFSFCLQSFPASESFTMSHLFISGGQSIGASASVLHWTFRVNFL